MTISEKMPKESAREYAMRIVKENIVSLQLVPGSLVSENEIALQLALSRTPVREALIELSKANIVETLPQKGSRIALIDYALVEESQFLRLVLECAAVKIVCENHEESDLSYLNENVELQDFYMKKENPDKILKLDNKFHEEIFKLANKQRCYQWMMDGMMVHFERVRILSLNIVKDSKIISDHKNILQAIIERNADEAVALMTKHLSRYKLDEELICRAFPDYIKQETRLYKENF